MTTEEIKAALARIGEIARKSHGSQADGQEAATIALSLLESFLLDHKRQTDLLEQIAGIAQFFENQRREGMG
jgi:hypothetical protein